MEETLKERIKDFGLSEDEEEYILSRDKEIIARLVSISEDDVLKEIVYSLVDEDIIDVNYSDEVILTFINACVYNFPYEASIYEVLLTQKGQDEEQIITELKLLAKVKEKSKIKYILSLCELKDLPLKNEFAETILNAKAEGAGEEIDNMAIECASDIQKNPYHYLAVAKTIANIEKSPLAISIIRNIIIVAGYEWVIKNNCLNEVISKFLKVSQYFQINSLDRLFRFLRENSSFSQIEVFFKGADLILQCNEVFQANNICDYFAYCLRSYLDIDLSKARTFLNAHNRETAHFILEVLESDNLRKPDFLMDSAGILNNSRQDYNFNDASALLKYPVSSLEYSLSAAQIINELTEKEKSDIIDSILWINSPYSLEIAAIANTLYDKEELKALELIHHNKLLREMGVSILMARIIGRATDYNYDIVALYEILNKEDNKEKVVNALKEELKSGIENGMISDPFLVADVINRVLGTTINANFALVEDKEAKKENKTILNKVLTKFKKSKKQN